jgi:hypothetical protein
MGAKARKWFLTWGLLFAVFAVRGLLPWLIVWLATPGLGPWEAWGAAFSNDPSVMEAVERSAPILLAGGGTFLVLLFFHWLFLETKKFGLPGEAFIAKQGIWFYAVASFLLAYLVWTGIHINPLMAFGATIGSSAFFLTHGFKHNAEKAEAQLKTGGSSDIAKIVYLEIIDLTFSIDGVLGAFAFTRSVPLILLGNGIGALAVRQLTMGNIERVKKLCYLKNGAMYSILGLGTVMLLEAFGHHVPHWISPVLTFLIIGYFLHKSILANKNEGASCPAV